MPDRLSKSLTFCAETTAHVTQRHDDGRTLPTGVLRTARATHAGGENASPQVDARDAHLCNLGEIQLQGAEMEVLLGTQSQCEARFRARAVKVSVSPKRQGHSLNRPLLFGVKSPSSVVLCTDASDTFCITWPTGNFAKACASNNFRTVSTILFLPHNFALRRGNPLSQTLSDRLLATLRFRRATGECTIRQGTQASESTSFALTVLDYSCRTQPTVRNLDARARMHARRVVQTTIPSAQQCKQPVVSGIFDDAATARSCTVSHVALHEVHAAQHSRREMGDVHRTPSASFLQCKSPLPLHSAPQRCVDESSDEDSGL